jgi:hypothetical protein
MARKPSHLGSKNAPPGSAFGLGMLLTSFARATATGGCRAGGMDSAIGVSFVARIVLRFAAGCKAFFALHVAGLFSVQGH